MHSYWLWRQPEASEEGRGKDRRRTRSKTKGPGGFLFRTFRALLCIIRRGCECQYFDKCSPLVCSKFTFVGTHGGRIGVVHAHVGYVCFVMEHCGFQSSQQAPTKSISIRVLSYLSIFRSILKFSYFFILYIKYIYLKRNLRACLRRVIYFFIENYRPLDKIGFYMTAEELITLRVLA